jgi:anaerobic selenocysteine-containing dehydrogenase
VRGLGDTAAGLPTPALADEILTPGDGQVRALFVAGGNPLAAFPNREKVLRALKSLDLLVVIDPQLSATAELADYVIGPQFGFELPAISFANEGMVTYGLSIGFQEPWAMYQPALIDPPAGADVIEDWRFFYELARRLDIPLGMRGYQWDMQNPPTTDALIEAFLSRSPVPLSEVQQYPSGHLFPERSAPAQAREDDWPYRLNIGHPKMLEELSGIAATLSTRSEPDEADAGELRLLLISRREHAVYNSVGHSLPALAARLPYNPVHLHPDDARELGVGEGERVELHNANACVSGFVAIDKTLRRGVVSVAHGFPGGARGEGDTFGGTSTAALIDDAYGCDTHSGLPRMSAVPVDLRRA